MNSLHTSPKNTTFLIPINVSTSLRWITRLLLLFCCSCGCWQPATHWAEKLDELLLTLCTPAALTLCQQYCVHKSSCARANSLCSRTVCFSSASGCWELLGLQWCLLGDILATLIFPTVRRWHLWPVNRLTLPYIAASHTSAYDWLQLFKAALYSPCNGNCLPKFTI